MTSLVVRADITDDEKRRGAIYTKKSVVDFMLDLMDYSTSAPLYEKRLLEPSFGGGRFLLSAVDRLIESWQRDNRTNVEELAPCIRAVELDPTSFQAMRAVLSRHLSDLGISDDAAGNLADTWLVSGDFLLSKFDAPFDYIVGNPPYVRQELIPSADLKKYRQRFSTMVGRADLYIAFMERSLDLLAPAGRLSFICADAWLKNDYGRAIRQKIANDFNLKYYLDLYGTDAFEVAVGAYPSITVMERSPQQETVVARADDVDADTLARLRQVMVERSSSSPAVQRRQVVRDAAPWLVGVDASLEVLHHLEENFPTLEEAGCRIGIGVATGADRVFIGNIDELDVEDERKVPLATNKCVPGGTLHWTGKAVVNPWRDEGGLVDLEDYPRLHAYLEQHREKLSSRHTAKASPSRWYKTIDRITPSLTSEPKLFIPDIKGNGDSITYDPGTLYPHHNLYFITSCDWNLRALQALLRTGVAHLFVSAYSVKIGGGYLRFQAQNLKRIRVPRWSDLAPEIQARMVAAGESGSRLPLELLASIYGLAESDLAFLEEPSHAA